MLWGTEFCQRVSFPVLAIMLQYRSLSISRISSGLKGIFYSRSVKDVKEDTIIYRSDRYLVIVAYDSCAPVSKLEEANSGGLPVPLRAVRGHGVASTQPLCIMVLLETFRQGEKSVFKVFLNF